MARLTGIAIEGYRSIGDEMHLHLPANKPLVLLGENNAGKSNVVRALELVLGERYPGNHSPEDHEFFGRDPTAAHSGIRATAHLADAKSDYGTEIERIELECLDSGTRYEMILANDSAYRVSNSVREQCPVIVVGTDRNLQYQLSYASQWTLLSKLMQRFHRALLADEDRSRRLRQHFETLRTMFGEVQEFAEFAQRLSDEVTQLSTSLQYGLDIDFSAYDPSNYFKALRVQPRLGHERRSFDELGTGQQQILALGFAYAYADAFASTGAGLVLVVEEPEAHLHPLAQEWLAAQMQRFCSAGAQIVITTHSPAFIDLCTLDGLVLIRKDGETSSSYATQRSVIELTRFCQQHNAPKAQPKTILDFYEWSATNHIKSGFFARAVVLVEGPTEDLALPVLLAKAGLNVAHAGVAVVPVGGRAALARWWRLFTAYEIPVYVVFDNDSSDDPSGRGRDDLLTTMRFDAATASELSDVAGVVVRPEVTVFGPDFERFMRAQYPTYVELEAQARDIGLLSKPLCARWVADRLDIGDETPIHHLAAAVRQLADPQLPSAGGAVAGLSGRPVLAEPASLRRLPGPILRHHRSPASACTPPARRHPGRHSPAGGAPGPGGHLPPGLVATP